jgi:alpha-glucosidase (family GH31 glycosyl hydrolase)
LVSSVNPFRILDNEHANAVKEAVALRQKFVPMIMGLVENASKTGEPIVRSMEYVFPHQGYAEVKDQFLLGDKYLIAPVLAKNATKRKVLLPKGRWKDAAGKIWRGGKEIEVAVGLTSLPYFERL